MANGQGVNAPTQRLALPITRAGLGKTGVFQITSAFQACGQHGQQTSNQVKKLHSVK